MVNRLKGRNQEREIEAADCVCGGTFKGITWFEDHRVRNNIQSCHLEL